MSRAYALINVKPMQTIEILEELRTQIETSDGPTKVRAYTMGIWAAQYISSISHVQRYRNLLVAMANSEAFSENKAAILSALVAQYWRTQQYNLAKQFGICALKNADSEARVVSIGITMSIALHRHLLHNFGAWVSTQWPSNLPFAAYIIPTKKRITHHLQIL
ncbi:MAG: hypothetical protein GJ680_12235 [Alteromonadaceae bacterium]|nr:hypothetical protein [Alteromonadaceae bacterium]